MHPNRFELERFSADDLPAAERSTVQLHLTSCERCRRIVDDVAALAVAPGAAVERFVAEVRVRRAAARQRSRLAAATGAVTLFAAAAALLLWLRPVGHGPRDIKWKGAGLTVQRLRDGEARMLGGDETIRAGDALRVIVTQPRAQSVGAWLVDARGRVDALLPAGPVSLPDGPQVLPGSAVIDAPCVDSWLVVALGDGAAQAEAALRGALAGGVPDGERWIPAGTLVRRLHCQ
jgi:hypothetical protein